MILRKIRPLLVLAALAASQAVYGSFQCKNVYTSCTPRSKTAIKIGFMCTTENQCEGMVEPREGERDPGETVETAGCGLYPDVKDYYLSRTSSNNPEIGPNYYIHKERGTDGSKIIPFPDCIKDACGFYKMTAIPTYKK
jgi:hypothetical protein